MEEEAHVEADKRVEQEVEETKTEHNHTEMKDELLSKTPYKKFTRKYAASMFKSKREQKQLRAVFTEWKQKLHTSHNERVRTPTNSDAERKEGSPTTPPQKPISPSGSNSQSRGTGTRLLNKEDKLVSSPSAPALDETMQSVPPQTGETTPIESATPVSPSVESSPGLMARWGEEGSGWY